MSVECNRFGSVSIKLPANVFAFLGNLWGRQEEDGLKSEQSDGWKAALKVQRWS